MKAYVKDEHQKKGRFGGHKYRLTIAMPVSNQVKTIRRCLDSLVPLLEAVPSELIITDTGSTDGTIEIAREYTDHIEVFPWCDDMSAARNVGMRAAQGEWFLSVDDDEWFENVDEIIEFFNSGECDDYGSASYIQRNYTKLDGSQYLDHHTSRIARLVDDGVHFEGRIHDAIIGRYNPTKMLHSYVHHYGFVYANEEDRLAKFHRNITSLLKDNEEFPHELRFIYQIIKEYAVIKDYKTAIEWCLKGLAIEKEYPEPGRRLEITVLLVKYYYNDDQYQLAIDTADDFITENKKIETYHMDIYWLQMLAYNMLQQYDKAIESGLYYLDIYKKFKAGKLDNEALLVGGSDSMMPWALAEAYYTMSKCYLQLNDYDNAASYFFKINFSEMDTVAYKTVLVGLSIADDACQYERVADLYFSIQKLNDEKRQQDFIDSTEVYIKQHEKSRIHVAKALAQVDEDSPYILLNKLRAANEENNQEEKEILIDWFINNFKDWSPVYSDVLYVAMKDNMDIIPFVDLFDVDDLQLYTAEIVSAHLDFAAVTIYYFLQHSYKENLKALYWSICLRERVVLYSEGMNFEQYIMFFKAYALDVASYAHQIYKPDMFTDGNISILPRAYRFGHYMGLAFEQYQVGDEVGYIRNLNIALQHYPIMKEPIKTLTEYLEEQHKQQEQKDNQQNKEFAELANEVKSQIEQLLLQEEYGEAESVLAELAELLPDDEDVKRYRLQIQSANGVKEIGRTILQ